MKILIADDNEQGLYLLRTVLEHAGHEVWPAADGAEALAIAGRQLPDAIITDILMPRLDGFALCRAIRQSERLSHLPLLFYSATYTDARDRELGLAVGADRFLEKPLEPGDLLRELEAAVDERRRGAVRGGGNPLEERAYLREYNERLVRKLEDKMLDLDRTCRELAGSERRYHELFDVASDVIFTLAPDGRFSLVNRRILETLGFHPAELLGQPIEPLIVASDRERARRALAEGLAGQRMTIELDFLSADGRPVAMHVLTVPLWQGQRPSGLMGIARDVSERAGTEAARLAAARLEGAGAAARRLLDELEGPLAAGLAAARELATHADLSAAARQRVTTLEGALRATAAAVRQAVAASASPVP